MARARDDLARALDGDTGGESLDAVARATAFRLLTAYTYEAVDGIVAEVRRRVKDDGQDLDEALAEDLDNACIYTADNLAYFVGLEYNDRPETLADAGLSDLHVAPTDAALHVAYNGLETACRRLIAIMDADETGEQPNAEPDEVA